MKGFAVALSQSRCIPALLGLVLLSACTEQRAPKAASIVVGSNVTLTNHALACEKPSDELNQVADSNGAVQNDIVAKVAGRRDCHDSAAFVANGQWRVLAVNDKQLHIKMRGYLGEYWVARAQVVPVDLSAKPASAIANAALTDGPVTVDEWRKSLVSAFEQSDTKKSDEGVTTFFASFHKEAYAFGKYDSFAKMYMFTPPATEIYGEMISNIRCYVLIADGHLPVIAMSPLYVNRDSGGDLYMKKLSILVDGELLFDKTFRASDVKRGRLGYRVTESANAILSEDEVRTLRKITEGSHVAIRLTGDDGYVNLKKDGPVDPILFFKKSITESLSVYDKINRATAGHMPDLRQADL